MGNDDMQIKIVAPGDYAAILVYGTDGTIDISVDSSKIGPVMFCSLLLQTAARIMHEEDVTLEMVKDAAVSVVSPDSD